MSMIGDAFEALKVLVPPRADDAEAQQRWRWVVFTSIIGLLAANTAQVVLAWGYVPSVYPGFALASETKHVEERLDLITTLSLEREMRAKVEERCKTKDSSLRQELNEDMDRLQKEYYTVTKQWYRLPSCEDL